MIYDKLDNIEIYKKISEDLYEGLRYLKLATSESANGIYQITQKVKAIVSEYETKQVNGNGYEAHRKNIDIQYPLIGVEKVRCAPIQRLSITKDYDADGDYLLYDGNTPGSDLIIGNGYFLVLFPDDGHMPQLCIGKPKIIKKLTVKVLLK